MKPHKEYRSAIVFCWWPTPVWCADYIRDGGVWLRRAEKRTYRNGRVKFFRLNAETAKKVGAVMVSGSGVPASLSGLESVADQQKEAS